MAASENSKALAEELSKSRVLIVWATSKSEERPNLQAIRRQDDVAILGDGKMGLLVAQVVALHTETAPLHIGRHQEKLDLVKGTRKLVLGADNKLPEDVKQVRLS